MVIKRVRCQSWEELKNIAWKYESLGYIVECRGWDDIRANILTIMTDEKETENERM